MLLQKLPLIFGLGGLGAAAYFAKEQGWLGDALGAPPKAAVRHLAAPPCAAAAPARGLHTLAPAPRRTTIPHSSARANNCTPTHSPKPDRTLSPTTML
jgi:hypothetical protein